MDTMDRSAPIACAVVASRLGRLRVEGTRSGLRSVGWLDGGETDAACDGAAGGPRERVAAWALRLAASLEPGADDAALPVDPVGTAFQRAVWSALRDIPRGETRSYGEIARVLGRPGAARAVGRACAANPVAVAVPCHRVGPADGGLGGYAWGAGRKRALLILEGAADPGEAAERSAGAGSGSSASVHRWSAA